MLREVRREDLSKHFQRYIHFIHKYKHRGIVRHIQCLIYTYTESCMSINYISAVSESIIIININQQMACSTSIMMHVLYYMNIFESTSRLCQLLEHQNWSTQWICRFDQILISHFCTTTHSPPIIFALMEKHHE